MLKIQQNYSLALSLKCNLYYFPLPQFILLMEKEFTVNLKLKVFLKIMQNESLVMKSKKEETSLSR